MSNINNTEFLNAYLECALWSSISMDTDEPLDADYNADDFDAESLAKAKQDCDDFIEANRKDLEAVGDSSQHGHDFWLTRNGHGAGFWDKGYGDIGTRLTEASKVYGESTIIEGDNKVSFY